MQRPKLSGGAVTDFRRANEVLEEDGIDEEAETQIVENPFVRDADSHQSRELGEAGDLSENESVELPVDVEDVEISYVSSWNQELVQVSAEEVMEGLRTRDSFESLRDSEVDSLLLTADGPLLATDPTPILTLSPLPPELGGPPSRASSEPTARIPLPRTHPLANSIAPTTAPKTVPPQASNQSPFWQMVAAAAILVGLGAAGSKLHSTAGEPAKAAATSARSLDGSPSFAAEPVREAAPSQLAAQVQEEPVLDTDTVEALEPNQPADVVATAPEAEGPAPASEPVRDAQRREREVSELVSVATGPRPERVARAKGGNAKAQAEVPAQLSREQVVSTMRTAMPHLSKCTGGRAGLVQAQLTVRNTGKVTYALVQGSFAATQEGSCLASALREVRFPAFGEPTLRLTYPLQF